MIRAQKLKQLLRSLRGFESLQCKLFINCQYVLRKEKLTNLDLKPFLALLVCQPILAEKSKNPLILPNKNWSQALFGDAYPYANTVESSVMMDGSFAWAEDMSVPSPQANIVLFSYPIFIIIDTYTIICYN